VKETAAAFAAILDASNKLGRAFMAKKPVIVKPGEDYLAVVCVKCSQQYPVEAPASAKLAKGRPSGPLEAQCPFCKHKAVYSPDKVKRITGSHEE
jgi:DNA-directed RNA polymerase subunit RPC12/RpoP